MLFRSTEAFNPALHPCLSDLTMLNSDTMIYNIKHSKTNQFGKSIPLYLFKINSYLSPYEPLAQLLQLRLSQNAQQSDPLFITETGSVVSCRWFHNLLHLVLALSGYPPEQFSAHSFRIGAASSATRQGLPDHMVQLLGRWSSQAYHGYIRTQIQDLRQAHEQLASI